MLLLAVDVTRKDIDQGNQSPRWCPIALAAMRALRAAGLPECRVEWEPYRAFSTPAGLSVIGPAPGGEVVVCSLPPSKVPYDAYEFASLFDDWWELHHDYGGDVASYEETTGEEAQTDRPAPFSFRVSLPLEVA